MSWTETIIEAQQRQRRGPQNYSSSTYNSPVKVLSPTFPLDNGRFLNISNRVNFGRSTSFIIKGLKYYSFG